MGAHQASSDTTKVWDRESIKAGLRREGYSLARIDRENGRQPGWCSAALVQPMPKAEAAMAEILGVEPQQIWPDRYGPDGRSLRGRFLPKHDGSLDVSARQPDAENVS